MVVVGFTISAKGSVPAMIVGNKGLNGFQYLFRTIMQNPAEGYKVVGNQHFLLLKERKYINQAGRSFFYFDNGRRINH